MIRRRPFPPICAALVAMASCALALAQTYPGNKPIRVTTSGPGSGANFVARIIAAGLTDSLGRQAIVDNRVAGVILGEIVARATPDGHTLLISANSFWMTPLLRPNVPWDPVKDFAPVSLAVSAPNVLVVHPGVPARDVRELIALAKAKPGELNYASGATGATSHLAPELFKAMAGVDITHIPFKGAGPALTGLIAAQVQLAFPTAGSVVAHVKSGKLRALAVTSLQPSAIVPDIPTVAASGLPGYESIAPYGVLAPARTPVPILTRLHAEISKLLLQPEVKERFYKVGIEVVAGSREQLAETIKGDIQKWGKVIRDAGISGG